MAKRKESPTSRVPKRAKLGEVESNLSSLTLSDQSSTQRLDKLPQKVWEKILDHLNEKDLFPLALSCRYFRQKQKELVERTRQSGPGSGKPRRALVTDVYYWPQKGHRASADYLQFIREEEVPRHIRHQKALWIRCLAALHGHLPLLQELQAGSEALHTRIIQSAGGSSFPRSLPSSFLVWLLT